MAPTLLRTGCGESCWAHGYSAGGHGARCPWLTPSRQGQFLPAAPSIPSCGLQSIQDSSQHAPQLSLLGPPSPRCPFGVKADLRLELRTTKKCPRAQVSLEKQTRGATGLAEQMETKETHGVSRPRWLRGATPAARTPSEPWLDGGNREGTLQLLQRLPGGAAGPEAPPIG